MNTVHLQWMHAAFIDHRPLTEKNLAWAKQVAARINKEQE